jgi:hypothetical protein
LLSPSLSEQVRGGDKYLKSVAEKSPGRIFPQIILNFLRLF